MPDEHSTSIGGSTAKRTINCPGWLKLSREFPAQPPGYPARRGTMLHEAIAKVLTDDFDARGFVYDDIELTPELHEDKIVPALAELDKLQDEHGDFDMAVENRVSLEEHIPGSFGTADIIARADKCSLVIDWKFGDGVMVSAEHNEQGLYYATAALHSPEYADLFEQDDKWPVGIVIIQPAAGRDKITDVWWTDVGYLRGFLKTLIATWSLVEEGQHFCAGDWCKFCPCNTPKCPALGGHVKELEKLDTGSLSPAEVGRWLAEVPALKAMIANIESTAFTLLEAGQPVTGYKLVGKHKRRYWTDPDAVLKTLRSMKVRFFDDPTTGAKGACDQKLRTPAQVEKLIKVSHKKVDRLLPFIDNKSSGTTIAPETDSRPAIVPGDEYADLAEKLKAKS